MRVRLTKGEELHLEAGGPSGVSNYRLGNIRIRWDDTRREFVIVQSDREGEEFLVCRIPGSFREASDG